MGKLFSVLPFAWGSLLGAAITEQTEFSLGLFLAGIGGTALLVWRARGEKEKLCERLRKLEDWRDRKDQEGD